MVADAYSTGAIPVCIKFDMGNLGFVVESDVSTGRSIRLDPKYSDVNIMKYQWRSFEQIKRFDHFLDVMSF